MKKLLAVLLLIAIVTMLYGEAPELKNMMPNSWQKVTRLTEQEEAEFLRKVDLREYFSDSNYAYYKQGNVLLDKEKVYTQIYREKCNSLEIYRVLSSDVPVEEALQITITDGVYTDEEKELFLKKPAISEIDFLKDGDTYKYIASIEYGAIHDWMPGFSYNYENIMYRAKNAEDVGVFITDGLTLFHVIILETDSNEFIFEKCKYKVRGRADCTYYENVKDLVEWDKDERKANWITIDSWDFLVDGIECPLKYSVQNAFDGNPATSYVENTENDSVEVAVYEIGKEITMIAIINGYAANMQLYKKNNRICDIISVFEDDWTYLNDDCLIYQCIQWGKNSVISTDIYKGERYNDTCMAEVNFFCNNSWLFGELNGKILQYDKDAK